jgi:hypothetical protein
MLLILAGQLQSDGKDFIRPKWYTDLNRPAMVQPVIYGGTVTASVTSPDPACARSGT